MPDRSATPSWRVSLHPSSEETAGPRAAARARLNRPRSSHLFHCQSNKKTGGRVHRNAVHLTPVASVDSSKGPRVCASASRWGSTNLALVAIRSRGSGPRTRTPALRRVPSSLVGALPWKFLARADRLLCTFLFLLFSFSPVESSDGAGLRRSGPWLESSPETQPLGVRDEPYRNRRRRRL